MYFQFIFALYLRYSATLLKFIVLSDIHFTQEWNNRTLAVHERVDCRFLVLPGSRSTITEITEYTYFSLLKPRREFEYKSE